MAWWNSSWGKKKKITLTGGSSGAQTNYQLKLTVTYDSDMKSDFSDLRFTNGAEDTLIDAWLESKIDSTSAVVWVEFPTTPANTVEQTYYMYYGNAGAASDWDGDATFVKYIGSRTTGYISALDITSPGYAYRGRSEYDTSATMMDFGFGDSVARFPNNCVKLENYTASKHNRSVTIAGSKTGYVGDLTWSTGTPYIYDITFLNSLVKWYKDGVQWHTDHTGSTPTAAMGLHCHVLSGSGTFYWQFIRKYAANPSTYAFGAEQSAPTAGARPPRVFYGPFHGPLGGPI